MRVTATDDGVRHCLVINDVEQSDAGQYVVKLTDRHDDALVQSLSAKLVVIPRPRTAAGTRSALSPLLGEFSPGALLQERSRPVWSSPSLSFSNSFDPRVLS